MSTGCSAADCYSDDGACTEVFDGTAGGWVGAASIAAGAWEVCNVASCAAECDL